MPRPRVLVTGGAGYLGSHCCKVLAATGTMPVVMDNLSTGRRGAVLWGPLIDVDIRVAAAVESVIRSNAIDTVLHFAATPTLAGDQPGPACEAARAGLAAVLDAAASTGVRHVVLASIRTGLGGGTGPDAGAPRHEPGTAAGRTAHLCEEMLRARAPVQGLRYVILRHVSVAGADPDGVLGAGRIQAGDLVPEALLAAAGRRATVTVPGTDHPTPDGSRIRDFVHVADLARAHAKAARHLAHGGASLELDIGTGEGVSVFEVIDAVQRVTGRTLALDFAPRRAGDPPALVADATRAADLLGFTPRLSRIETILRHAAPGFGLTPAGRLYA
jgi:UDP-arabinose 4-epimerase